MATEKSKGFKKQKVVSSLLVNGVAQSGTGYDLADFLLGTIPTAENMAIAFWNILAPKITEGTLRSIKLYESANNVVEYRG